VNGIEFLGLCIIYIPVIFSLRIIPIPLDTRLHLVISFMKAFMFLSVISGFALIIIGFSDYIGKKYLKLGDKE